MADSTADNFESPLGNLYQITRVIADTASDAIITIDEQSTIHFANRAAEKIFGYTRDELVGQSLTMLMPDYLRHVHSAGLQRYLSTGERHISWEAGELPGRHKDGREIPLELSLGEFTEHGQRFFTGIARDVTERRKLERTLAAQFEIARDARREAEAASRAKDEFLTTISHELRTPLTPVIGWIHMIRTGILPPKEIEHGLAVIEKNSYALKRLINDLLDMSAILSGKMRMEELPVSLGDVVNEAVETVRPLAAAGNIHLDLTFADWQKEIVSGDRARLLQVFWNLLSNAIKFSSPGGRVRVDCEAQGGDAVVHVEDAGQGIAADFLPFVFDRFRQADGSKTRVHGGLGLGLALVKSFVEAHQGQVEAESRGLGQGSRFTVRLPRRTGLTTAATREILETETGPGSASAQLMVVEDDPDTLEMLRATLEARGFRVTTCQSAADMLATAARERADLLISDIGMPEMDGFEMIKRLRELPGFQNVPAIALTGYASEKDADSALAAGFNAHVSKPVDANELVALVEGLLRDVSGTAS